MRQSMLMEFPDQKIRVEFTHKFPRDLRADTEARILEVLEHFPEMNIDRFSRLKVGFTEAYGGNAINDGGFYIRLAAGSDRYTIAHELTHHLQFAGLIPDGEKSCDLFTFARHISFCDGYPCYLQLPIPVRAEWGTWSVIAHEMAVEALRRRDVGLRTYIQWWEHTMECLYAKFLDRGWLST